MNNVVNKIDKRSSPIILHGQFRCGSTYLFNRMRLSDDFHCYYEPLHHELSRLRSDQLDLWGYDSKVTEQVNHPELAKPHFYEFGTCFKGESDSLPYFEKSYSYDMYYKVVGESFSKYISNLIDSTPADRQPVLQFNRTSMRVDWFVNNIKGGRNVTLIRSPRDQFDSYVKTSNGVFLALNLLIMTRSSPYNCSAHLTRQLLVPGFVSDNVNQEIKHYLKITESLSLEDHYRIFFSLWLDAYIHSSIHSNLMVDMNEINSNLDYKKSVESYLGCNGLFHGYKMSSNDRHCMKDSILNKVEKEFLGKIDQRMSDEVKEKYNLGGRKSKSGFIGALGKIKRKVDMRHQSGAMGSDENVPVISIVTPSYNQGQFIEETIKSIISQAGKFLIDYIVVDGLSSDNTMQIVKRYSELVNSGESFTRNGVEYYKNDLINCNGISLRYVSEEDSGQANAINKGFSMAKGSILGWLNSDDMYYSENSIWNVLISFKNNSVHFVYGRGVRVEENGVFVREENYVNNFKPEKIKHVDFILQPSAFWRKDVYDDMGPLEEKYHYVFDWEYWMRISKKYDLIKNNNMLSCYRVYGDTKTTTGGDKRKAEIISLLKSYDSYNDEAKKLNNLI